MPPALLKLATVAEYQQHYVRRFCAAPIVTHDGIPVYFKKSLFAHAFYESVNGQDNTFSLARAERMGWIMLTLRDATTQRFQGYVHSKKRYDPRRRVELKHGDFIVVLVMALDKGGNLKAEFLTCYPLAAGRRKKITAAPLWNAKDCKNAL